MLLFLLLSFFFLLHIPNNTPHSGHYSQELQQSIVTEGNLQRSDFLNKDGEITVALDLGYSTKIVTKTQSGSTEEYFNPNGDAVKCNLGYHAKSTIYYEAKRSIFISYFDSEGNPTVLSRGYSSEECYLDEYGRSKIVYYYDAFGEPVNSIQEGYGKKYEYVNGKVSRITFLDQDGRPVVTGKGYASIVYSYYSTDGPENGKIENEFYFDSEGLPIQLELGQFGEHKGYDNNGRNSVATYLDERGNTIITKKGYASVWWGYVDGCYCVKYYDPDGNPYKLNEGQYGIKVVDGQTIYLNEKGEEQFNFRIFLYRYPVVVIIVAVLIILLSVAIKEWPNRILLLLYVITVVYFTLLYRDNGINRIDLSLFRTYRQFFSNDEARTSILLNIWLFIPLGSILFSLTRNKKILLVSIALSAIIEVTQYITGTGYCDLDDVISNCIGAFIGYKAGGLLYKYKQDIIANKNKKIDL